jgi:hypothetical protein
MIVGVGLSILTWLAQRGRLCQVTAESVAL